MLESQHATLRDIEAIVVVNGPGSFTGIRVGLSTAKGLAEGAGIPLIAVSRLALLAGASGLPHVLAAVDAGRGEYYVGEYQNGQNLGEVLLSGEETVAAWPNSPERECWFATRALPGMPQRPAAPVLPWLSAGRSTCNLPTLPRRSVLRWAGFARANLMTSKPCRQTISAAPMPRFSVPPELGLRHEF